MNSFAIDASSGLLTAVSSIGVGGYPDDLLILGSTVFASSPSGPTTIDVFSLGNGCALTLLQQNNFPNERDIVLAQLTSSEIVTANLLSGNINTYRLGKGGTLTEIASVPGQIQNPQGVVVMKRVTPSGTVLNVYTGVYSVAEAQGFQATTSGTMIPLTGSPQTSSDPSSSFGGAVLVDRSRRLLLQANQRSHQISWYRVTVGRPGSPGSLTYSGDTTYPLRSVDTTPIEMGELGNTLFVATIEGDIQACTVSERSGVSGCASAATLPPYGSGNSNSGAIVIF